jgi:hypothetical protein
VGVLEELLGGERPQDLITIPLGGRTDPDVGRLAQLASEWQALQALHRDPAAVVDQTEDLFLTATQIYQTFGVTPTALRRLAAAGKIRRTGCRARRTYALRDVLLAVLNLGEGRIRRRRRATAAC